MIYVALPLLALLGCWVWIDLERLRRRMLEYAERRQLEDTEATKGKGS